MENDPPAAGRPAQQLSLLDSTCIILGIIVGVGIYETAPTVAASSGYWLVVLGIWVLGGLLSLAGALCYAELATTYPDEGGDYVYLSRAYGSWAGFLFGWGNVLVIRPGVVASMAFPFAHYLKTLWSPLAGTAWEGSADVIVAVAATIVLTAVNMVHISSGKWVQNLLTLAKIAGIILIVLVAAWALPQQGVGLDSVAIEPQATFGLALILVLFTYGGWNEIAYVAAEVRDPSRNIVRALIIGTGAVTVLYVLINLSFLAVLGHAGAAGSEAVATDTVAAVFPDSAAALISALICISALGAMNGLIFAGARISYAFGAEHRPFAKLAHWSGQRQTPAAALLVQGILSVAVIVLAGTFSQTVVYTTAVVWFFFLASGLALAVLRRREPNRLRPFRVPWYPFTPLVFVLCAAYQAYSAFVYNWQGSLLAITLLLAGLPVYWYISHICDCREGMS